MNRLLRAMQLISTTPSSTQDEAAATLLGSPLAAYIDTLVEEGELTIPDPLNPNASYWLRTMPALHHIRRGAQHALCVRWRESGVGTGRQHREERRLKRAEIERNFSTLIAAIIVGMPVFRLSDGLTIPGEWDGLQLGDEPAEPQFVWQPEPEPPVCQDGLTDVTADVTAAMGITEAPPRRREIIHVRPDTEVELVLGDGRRLVIADGALTMHYGL